MPTVKPRSKKIWRWLKQDMWSKKGIFGTNERGHSVPHYDADIVKFTINGALFKCYPALTKREEIREKIQQELRRMGFDCSIGVWEERDTVSWEHVHKLLKKLGI